MNDCPTCKGELISGKCDNFYCPNYQPPKTMTEIEQLRADLEGVTRQREELKRQLDIAIKENLMMRVTIKMIIQCGDPKPWKIDQWRELESMVR